MNIKFLMIVALIAISCRVLAEAPGFAPGYWPGRADTILGNCSFGSCTYYDEGGSGDDAE